jgi:hypothetical protein
MKSGQPLKIFRFSFSKFENLIIPYEEHVKIQVLQELQELLKKFNFSEKKSQEVQSSLDSFYQEKATFENFSNQARVIRNYKFDELKQDKNFVDFCQVVQPIYLLFCLYHLRSSNRCKPHIR